MSIYQGNQLVAGCITASVPTGSIIPFAGSTAPTGFLLCDGSAVSRTTYSALYDVIGTTYGPGDGNTTFNLPQNSNLMKVGDIPCKGNSMTLGLTNGTTNYGLNGSGGALYGHTSFYGQPVSTTASGGSTIVGHIGITTDSTKSGIVADTSSLTISCIWLIKY